MDLRALRHALAEAASSDATVDVMSREIKAFGFDGFDAFSIVKDSIDAPWQPFNAFACDYGLARIQEYLDAGWYHTDPGIQEMGRRIAPFEYVSFLKSSPANSAVLGQKALLLAAGVRRAWCVPVNTVERIQGVTWYQRGSGPEREGAFSDAEFWVQAASTVFLEDFLPKAIQAKAEKLLANAPPSMTPREADCLHWVAQGKTNWEIASILGVSENTVRYHLKNAYKKLGANSRGSAVKRAMRSGAVS